MEGSWASLVPRPFLYRPAHTGRVWEPNYSWAGLGLLVRVVWSTSVSPRMLNHR